MHFFHELEIFWSAKKLRKDTFFHPPSPFPRNICNCNSGGICTASQFQAQIPLLYTAGSNTYSEISPKVMLRPLARKITKGIHSCNSASLNRPIPSPVQDLESLVSSQDQHDSLPYWQHVSDMSMHDVMVMVTFVKQSVQRAVFV